MGRMLQALKRAESAGQIPRLAQVSANEETPASEAVEAEIPFIEWGPRKSMEASPSVLAAPGPVKAPRVADETAVALVAPPVRIQFRPLSTGKSHCQLAAELIAFHDPQSPISTQYRELLSVLLAGRLVAEPQALLFTAAHPGSGTTMTLLNVAITAARLGRRRIAVVDANLSKPGVAAALGLPEKPGLREVLAGITSLDEALQETAQPDLLGLTAGVTQATSGIRFMAETVRSLLRRLRQRFDLIFVDTPAWDGTAETINLATACDAVLVVLAPHETDTPRIDELLRRLPEQGAKLAGCVLVSR